MERKDIDAGKNAWKGKDDTVDDRKEDARRQKRSPLGGVAKL